MSILLLILGLVLFACLVVVHEWGHFKVARRHDVDVEEFGIGFPPRAKVIGQKNGTVYTLNWLPIGGFVRLKGERDMDKQPHSYGLAPLSVKVKILLAGVGMNLLTAFIMLTALAWLGMPLLVPNQYTVKSDTKTLKNEVLITSVESNSPASKVGIKSNDQIVAVGLHQNAMKPVTSSDNLPNITKSFAGQKVYVTYIDKGQQQTVQTTLRSTSVVQASQKTSSPKGYLGVEPTDYTLQRSTWSAPVVAAGLLWQFTALTFEGLGHVISALFHGHPSQAAQQVTGPVGIYYILRNGSLLGYQFILLIIAVISLTLAIMNLLPIPALDGGKLYTTLIFHGLKKPLTETIENWVYGTGFAFVMMLIVLITIVDIRRGY